MTMPNKTAPLDQEEQDLFEALEQMDTKNLPPVTPEQQKLFREAAANFVSKETSPNITMDLSDMAEIMQRAAHRGTQCQLFVREILHKYLAGQLVEKNAC
jgi:predicted DNA binding CopG/RHH family protein